MVSDDSSRGHVTRDRSENVRGLNEDSSHVRHLASKFLAGEANEVGTGDHGDVCETEDEDMAVGHGVLDGDGGRNERPEDVDGAGQPTSRPPDNLEEHDGVDASATALTGSLDLDWALWLAVMAATAATPDILAGARQCLVARAASTFFPISRERAVEGALPRHDEQYAVWQGVVRMADHF